MTSQHHTAGEGGQRQLHAWPEWDTWRLAGTYAAVAVGFLAVHIAFLATTSTARIIALVGALLLVPVLVRATIAGSRRADAATIRANTAFGITAGAICVIFGATFLANNPSSDWWQAPLFVTVAVGGVGWLAYFGFRARADRRHARVITALHDPADADKNQLLRGVLVDSWLMRAGRRPSMRCPRLRRPASLSLLTSWEGSRCFSGESCSPRRGRADGGLGSTTPPCSGVARLEQPTSVSALPSSRVDQRRGAGGPLPRAAPCTLSSPWLTRAAAVQGTPPG